MWPDLDVDGGTAESFMEFACTGIVNDILNISKGKQNFCQNMAHSFSSEDTRHKLSTMIVERLTT